jgi:putative endonuclease
LPTASAIGTYGERVAAAFLRRHGYRVLTRNFSVTGGELDLVCRDGEMLVFVEVRTRGSALFGQPAESIDARKEEALRLASRRYLELLDNDEISYRFDVVEVTLKPGVIPACSLLKNVFS